MEKECNILRQSSLYVRNWTNTQPNVKEESLTDWLLFNVSEKTTKITYRDFTRHEEFKTTGADWEWWFIFPNFSYKFRVQAKKTKTTSNNYRGMTYPNKTSTQMGKLISDAYSNNAIPIYAYYTNKIDRVKCNKKILDEGVYLISAIDLKNKFVVPKITKIDYNDILEDTIPLSCLLCCELQKNPHNNNPDNFERFIKEYFNQDESNVSQDSASIGKHSKTPYYVESLFEFSNKDLPDYWEKEFEKSVDGLNGIMIFDRR